VSPVVMLLGATKGLQYRITWNDCFHYGCKNYGRPDYTFK